MSGYPDASSYPHHPPPLQNQPRQLTAQGQQQQQHSVPPAFYNPQNPNQNDQPQQQQQSYYQHSGHNVSPNGQSMQQQMQQQVPAPAPATPSTSTTKDGQPKQGRLGRACDLCSMRKVKCDNGDPCKPCKSLNLPCTKERESKRRGPPNKHAEAIKRHKAGQSAMDVSGLSSPASPNNVAATLASFSSHAVLNAESILPFSTLKLLVDDFFTYIHPLAPFPHEPSFRQAFMKRQDLHSAPFLALLASMIAALVASFPRKPKLHLKAQHLERLFPSSLSLVERCHKVAVEARGTGYLDGPLTVWDAVTSYFLGLASAYTFQWPQTRLYFGETLNISRVVGAHRVPKRAVNAATGSLGRDESTSIDHIQQEVGRRMFWIMVTGIRSLHQIGGTYSELFIPPPTPNEPYPPLPAEVDDEFIFIDHVGVQPSGLTSKLTGFNMGVRIYNSLTELGTLEMCYGIDQVFDWAKQKRVLDEALNTVKSVLANLPPELQLKPSLQVGEFESNHPQYYPPIANYADVASNGGEVNYWSSESYERRKLQFEIQKANIYASGLATRSYIVEKYGNLEEAFEHKRDSNVNAPEHLAARTMAQSASPNYDEIQTNVTNEREIIVKDFLHVLQSISQVNMEPNGPSFINKIRQVASTLVDQPQGRKGPLALKSEEYLSKFLDVLMRLERATPARKSDVTDDEEEELRSWADLRENQMKFAQAGGFLNDS